MRVRILSPYPDEVSGPILSAGDEIVDEYPDWILSYGHREIIREPMLSEFAGRIVNIHLSLLPWNRGADPNFWSWFDATPKGISIHLIDCGIDTGPLLAQREVSFRSDETLRSSYARLRHAAGSLFAATWGSIRTGELRAVAQPTGGSFHRSRDKERWFCRLPLAFDTPVVTIAEIGREHRSSVNFWTVYAGEARQAT